jgi:hypothetical protein
MREIRRAQLYPQGMARKQVTTSSEETFSVNGAAKLTGFSVPTIRKRLPELKRAGAVMAGDSWAIPLSALHAVGLMSKIEASNPETVAGQVTGQSLQVETRQEIERLRGALSVAEQRAAVAEAVAAERLQALERADRALLMLEAASASEMRSGSRRGLFRRG